MEWDRETPNPEKRGERKKMESDGMEEETSQQVLRSPSKANMVAGGGRGSSGRAWVCVGRPRQGGAAQV